MNKNEVKVWNHNEYTHKETFKEKVVVIEPHKFVVMDYYDAVQFLGQFFPMRHGKDGVQDPRSYKYLQIDPDDLKRFREQRESKSDDKDQVFVCHRCMKEFLTKNGLLKHIKTRHIDEMADKDARDELLDDEDV